MTRAPRLRSRFAAAAARLAVAPLVLVCAAAQCRSEKTSAIDDEVVALVNGEIVSRAEFEVELARELQSIGPEEPRSPEQIEPYRRALLDTLVDRALLLQAARKANLTAPPEEVDRRVLRISSDYPAEGFDEALAQGKLSMPELRRKTAALLVIEKLFEEHVYPRVAVTEEEIREYYAEHKEQFQVTEQVRAAQIVVRTLDEARRLQQQLRQGKKFAELARKYSLSADAKVGGDLGFFARGVMPPAFDEVAFRLAVGQVSDVVTTDYGYHLFKVLERRPAQKRELGAVRAEVEQKILEAKRAEAQKIYLAKLRQEGQIVVNEPVLQTLIGKGAPVSTPAR
jgi:peptidyl-prolyl cis-trans isomerase C/foldase protein PrsA